MGIVIRQSVKASIISYIGAIIGYINIVFITPYCFPPEIVGLSRMFIEMAFFLTYFTQIGINSAIIRFFPYFKNENGDNGLFFLILVVPLLGFIFFGGIYLLIKDWLASFYNVNSQIFAHYLYHILPMAFVVGYFTIFEAYSSCLLRIVVPKFVRDVLLKILNIGIIVLYYFKFIGIDGLIYSIIGIYSIAMFVNLFYISKIRRLSLRPNFSFLKKPLVRQILFYLLFIMLGGIGTNLVSKFDIFMIGSSINLTNVGIFSIAFYITTVIEIPSRSILQISAPLVAESMKNNDTSKILQLYRKTSLNQFIIGSFILLLVWVNVDNIFKIMPHGDLYNAGKYVILFFSLGKMFDMITGANGLIIGNSKYYYYSLFFILYLSIISVGLNYFLIPRLGITGAGIASFIAIATYNLLLVAFLKVRMNIHPFTQNTLKAVFVFIIPLALNYFIPKNINPLIDGTYRTISISLIFILLLKWFKVSEDIDEIWKAVLDGKFFREIMNTMKFK